ncbi:MAG: arginine--tRNA ligase, partial [Bacteroidetes bacterium]|nr:arginine--tRNA ligase [Bacteroidota bacterium]
MKIEDKIISQIAEALKELFQIENATIKIEQTKKEFEGDYTFVVFPYTKLSKLGPEQTAEKIGQY